MNDSGLATAKQFKKYQRKQKLSELRPYVLGEDLTGISVNKEDDPVNDVGGMIARNPDNHNDQWYVAGKYFRDNFDTEPVFG